MKKIKTKNGEVVGFVKDKFIKEASKPAVKTKGSKKLKANLKKLMEECKIGR